MSNARYPTKYKVRHSCSHVQEHDLREIDGPKRQRRADWYKKGPCDDCYRAGERRPSDVTDDTATGAEATRDARSKVVEIVATPGPGTPAPGANEWFQRRSLPPLKGTPRQVESAVRIRTQLLAGAWAILSAAGWEENEFLIGVETYASQVLTAKWWIEHSSVAAHDLSDALQMAALVEKGEA